MNEFNGTDIDAARRLEWRPEIEIIFQKKRGQDRVPNEYFDLNDFIAVKSHKALGNQLTKNTILEIKVKALPYEQEEIKPIDSAGRPCWSPG